MTRLVTVVEMWGRRDGDWHKAVWTVDELRLIYPQKKNKPRKCRSHAVKVLRKRQWI
jgi:hypothetical protein